MQVYLQFDVGIVPTSCSFIKNETLHKCVLCILKNFSACIFHFRENYDSGTGVSVRNLKKVLACGPIKIKTPVTANGLEPRTT